MRVLFTIKDNSIIGNAIYTRYNALPWYKKALCFFSRAYRLKFIDCKGFKISGIDTSAFKVGQKLYISKSKPGEFTTNPDK